MKIRVFYLNTEISSLERMVGVLISNNSLLLSRERQRGSGEDTIWVHSVHMLATLDYTHAALIAAVSRNYTLRALFNFRPFSRSSRNPGVKLGTRTSISFRGLYRLLFAPRDNTQSWQMVNGDAIHHHFPIFHETFNSRDDENPYY